MSDKDVILRIGEITRMCNYAYDSYVFSFLTQQLSIFIVYT